MPITPNMLLNLPDPSVTPGPEWAAALNAAITAIDDHDHTSEKGKQVPISGVDINQNLDMQGLSVIDTEAVQFENLGSTLSGPSNINKFHTVSGNVWFTNSGGVPVQITDGNSIVSNIVIPSSPLMPSGALLDFAGGSAPVGFLLCDGSAVSRATYSDLFAAIGTAWGVGDGSTTFNIPNFSGRTSVGSGTYTDVTSGSVTRTLAQSLGSEAHLLTIPQLPSHTHTQNPHSHAQAYVGNAGIPSRNGYTTLSNLVGSRDEYSTSGASGTLAALTSSTTATDTGTGGDLAHNNMQPSLVVLKIIKT